MAKGASARAALIKAALCGWHGDAACSWLFPIDEETLISWAKSHAPETPDEDLTEVFLDLLREGLFFQVEHDVFEGAYYYCSFSSVFLAELSGHETMLACTGQPVVEFWDEMSAEYDDHYGTDWRKYGICAGQGSRGPSGEGWGPCLGKDCYWFKDDGQPHCHHELRFKRE